MRAGTVFILFCLTAMFMPLLVDKWLVVGLMVLIGPPLIWMFYREMG